MDNSKKRKIGFLAEKYVMLWLVLHGYRVIGHNFGVKGGEIDIIARKGNYIVFAEVKARQKGALQNPLAAVTPEKQRRIILAAESYMSYKKLNYNELQPRFDVIAVEINGIFFKVKEHIINAFN